MMTISRYVELCARLVWIDIYQSLYESHLSFVSFHRILQVNGVTIHKPFVEKPVSFWYKSVQSSIRHGSACDSDSRSNL